ncbi:hypothetical protein [Micromonospora sp. HM5-17]|jgi:hypothetical protein|uniref:hypothetical protein n=1 Tax=Micromonospora sp. HM5-17 TaxID=2487710 RepID=UPI000F48D702|nr:hypothetical protein [Micromonospora sp. HM5-17]ROT31580.1 hypothetical protein EF879_14240 [Micromonospora sp. HM5-17]
MAERKRLLLRLDPRVYDAIAKWAADDLRSVNAQIEFALRLALRTAGRTLRPATGAPSAGAAGAAGDSAPDALSEAAPPAAASGTSAPDAAFGTSPPAPAPGLVDRPETPSSDGTESDGVVAPGPSDDADRPGRARNLPEPG